MTVAELKQSSPELFIITFEDGTKLKSTLSVVADYSLYPGRELTEEEYAAVTAASGIGRAKDRALRMIGARPLSSRELYDKLLEKGEAEETAAEVTAWLVDMRLVNDADYAAMLVRHYAAKGYGPRRVRDELYRHKVPRELWDEALEQMPESDDTLDRLLRSRMRGVDIDDRAAVKKATDALLRRGYGWEEVRSALYRYNSSITEEY